MKLYNIKAFTTGTKMRISFHTLPTPSLVNYEQTEKESEIIKDSQDESWYYPLFEHMSLEHDLLLIDSQMDSIINVVKQMLTRNK